MFHYEVMSYQDAQQARFQLLKEGTYDAVIAKAEDRQSASGNPMMDVTLQVFDNNGKGHDIRDFLVFMPTMMWKVVNFAKSADILKEYMEGKLCSSLSLGKRVRVKVTVESGKDIPFDKLNGKPTGSKYPDKNKIEDYISVVDDIGAAHDREANEEKLDDDIPF